MQRKQKPCAPLPSNKNSRYYRPRVNVSNKNLTWCNDGSLLGKPTNISYFGSFLKVLVLWFGREGLSARRIFSSNSKQRKRRASNSSSKQQRRARDRDGSSVGAGGAPAPLRACTSRKNRGGMRGWRREERRGGAGKGRRMSAPPVHES